MEIFNIHLFEFLLIAGLALIIFGPERLPEVGRFAGRQVARFLAWQQQSPELKMINDVRTDIEQEIASLRDELVRTRKQLDLSQEANLNSIRDELRPMLNLRNQPLSLLDQTKDAPASAPGGSPTADTAPPAGQDTPPKTWDPPIEDDQAGAEALFDIVDDPAPAEAPAQAEGAPAPHLPPEGTPQAEGAARATKRSDRLAATEPTSVLDRPHAPPYQAPATAPLNGEAQASAGPAVSAEEIRLLMRQIESLSADLQTLISGLQAQGVIGADWQPDSAISEQESLSR